MSRPQILGKPGSTVVFMCTVLFSLHSWTDYTHSQTLLPFCVYKHYCHSYVIFVEKTIATKLHITKVFCLESFCLAITTLKQATFEGEMFRENTILRRKLLWIVRLCCHAPKFCRENYSHKTLNITKVFCLESVTAVHYYLEPRLSYFIQPLRKLQTVLLPPGPIMWY